MGPVWAFRPQIAGLKMSAASIRRRTSLALSLAVGIAASLSTSALAQTDPLPSWNDDAALADSLPAGSTGTAAIFTDRVKAAHVIRKVLLRQIAITNYVNPF
jgi:hypothetical protein